MNWQPIASAPKDGTHLLVWGASRGIDIAYFGASERNEAYVWQCSATGFHMDHEAEPTHWQSLPEPPDA